MSACDLADHNPPNLLSGWPRHRGEAVLRTFAFYIDDDRYTVPTLNIVTMTDEARARVWAESAMRANAHYLGVEVCEDGERLFGMGSLGDSAARGVNL